MPSFLFIFPLLLLCVSIPYYIQWMCSQLFYTLFLSLCQCLSLTSSLAHSLNVFNVKCLIVDYWLLIRAFVTTQILYYVYVSYTLILMLEFYTNKTAQRAHTNEWVSDLTLNFSIPFAYKSVFLNILSTLATTTTATHLPQQRRQYISKQHQIQMNEQTRTLIC